jgi:hypothetical protein
LIRPFLPAIGGYFYKVSISIHQQYETIDTDSVEMESLMSTRPIHADEDYRAALKIVSALFDNEPEPGTPVGDYFDIMIALIETYESKQFPVDPRIA